MSTETQQLNSRRQSIHRYSLPMNLYSFSLSSIALVVLAFAGCSDGEEPGSQEVTGDETTTGGNAIGTGGETQVTGSGNGDDSGGTSSGGNGSGAGGSSGGTSGTGATNGAGGVPDGSGGNASTGGTGGTNNGPTPNCLEDLPACVEAMAEAGGGTVVLAEATYLLTEQLDLESGVNIVGQGSGTVIKWDESVATAIDEPLLFTSSADNIELSDFYLECSIDQDPSSEDLRNDQIGLYYYCGGDPSLDEETGCNNLTIERLEVAHCSHGVHLKGLTGVNAIDLDLHDNGNTEVDFFHNVYFRRVGQLVVKQTTPTSGGFYDSPRGHGIRASHLKDVYFEGLSVFDNADHGVHMDNVYDVRMANMDIRDNCANSNGACAALRCYGEAETCDFDDDAPVEPTP